MITAGLWLGVASRQSLYISWDMSGDNSPSLCVCWSGPLEWSGLCFLRGGGGGGFNFNWRHPGPLWCWGVNPSLPAERRDGAVPILTSTLRFATWWRSLNIDHDFTQAQIQMQTWFGSNLVMNSNSDCESLCATQLLPYGHGNRMD